MLTFVMADAKRETLPFSVTTITKTHDASGHGLNHFRRARFVTDSPVSSKRLMDLSGALAARTVAT